jgi:hypothetical protein
MPYFGNEQRKTQTVFRGSRIESEHELFWLGLNFCGQLICLLEHGLVERRRATARDAQALP